MFEEARLIAPSRSRLAAALSVAGLLLVAGCYSQIPVEDGGTMPSAEADKPAMTPLEREQEAARAEQRKRVATLARTHPGGGDETAAGADRKKVASTDLAAKPDKATRDDERATAASAVSPGAGGYWVQIGSGRDMKDSEALWTKLRAAHSSILGDASHTIVRADLGPNKGVYYRVHVGPYDSADSASALCGRLRASGADCFLIGPRGSIMTMPEPRDAKVEPTGPVESEPASPAAPERPAPVARTTPPAQTKPAEAKPASPEPPAKAAAETPAANTSAVPPASAQSPAAKSPDTKSPEAASDVPFRTMGLPGLPE